MTFHDVRKVGSWRVAYHAGLYFRGSRDKFPRGDNH